MIEFRCRQCRENLDAPESMIGERIDCPTCGVYTRVPDPEPPVPIPVITPAVQTIERTGKRWKATQLIGIAAFLLFGFFALPFAMMDVSFVGASVNPTAVLCPLSFLGLAAFIYGRVGAWWHHG